VEFLSELPRTTVGKVHKRALRAPFWAGQERQVAGV
jgi:acyl-coenzyme A synthetase/AMP-(fatty) acid ligase